MKFGFSVLALNVALAGAIAPQAMAQSSRDNPFFRHRFIAVTERPQPDFDQVPLHAGAFLINSQLGLGATYDDNIFATRNKEGDTILSVRPQVDVTTNWSSNALNAGFMVDDRHFLDNDTENTTAYSGYLGGRLDVTRAFSINGQLNGGRFFENRYAPSSVNAQAKPVHFEQVGGVVSANYEFNRFQIQGTIDVTDQDFADAFSIGSTTTPSFIIDEDFRDNTTTNYGGRVSYAISPDIAVFVQAKHGVVEYDSAKSRNSTRNFYQVGANFELAAPFRGDIAAGYMETKQKGGLDTTVTPAAMVPKSSFDGLALDGRLQWFPTQITTLTLTGKRSVFDPGLQPVANPAAATDPTAPAFLYNSSVAFDTSVGLRVDHELRRNILLFGELSYEQQDFKGLDREDDITVFSTGVGYKLNRRAHLEFAYTLRDQDSSLGSNALVPLYGPNFNENIVSATLRLFP
jgi:hypothetical protein